MPTKKPRLAVTVSPEARDALERLTKASGVASSQFVSQLVHNAIPLLDAMTRAFTEAKKSPLAAAEVMREALGDAHLQVAQQQLALDEAIMRKKKRRLRKRPMKRTHAR